MTRMHLHSCSPLLCALLLSPAMAQEAAPADYATRAIIDGGSGSHSQGVLTFNITAGDFNLQNNSGALALSADGASLAAVQGTQSFAALAATMPTVAEAIIADDAFARAMGWVAINQSSGVGNGQANGLAMALSINGTAVADSTLAATLPEAELTSDAGIDPPGTRTATLEASTFRGAKGVVQVNQAAGSWNRTANNFALSISVDVNP